MADLILRTASSRKYKELIDALGCVTTEFRVEREFPSSDHEALCRFEDVAAQDALGTITSNTWVATLEHVHLTTWIVQG